MLKVSLIVLAVCCMFVEETAAARNKAVPNKRGLKKLLESLDQGVYATCEMVFFPDPAIYKNAVKSCSKLRLGAPRRPGKLATVDSAEKSGHLALLHDVAYPLDEEQAEVSENTKFAWIGLQKVKNNDKIYTKRQMKRKKNVEKEYNVKDWKWMGTRKFPKDYENWYRRQRNAQPDQIYMKNKGKWRRMGCKTKGGCFQNQVKVSQETTLWDDAYDFEAHPYACDYRGKYVISNHFVKWTDAVKACKAAGLTLATVRNKMEVIQLKQAIELFLGKGDETWDTWDPHNWLWLGGSDLDAEGDWRWLNGDPVESWDVPWRKWAGKDNGRGGQHALAFSRWGEFDDSHHDHKKRLRNFACECP